jgi:hypothetical protein
MLNRSFLLFFATQGNEGIEISALPPFFGSSFVKKKKKLT